MAARPGDDQLVLDFLHNVDDDVITCRSWRHELPRLRPNQKLPRGVRGTRWADGTSELEFTCKCCGAVATVTLLAGGVYDTSAPYRMKYPPGYLAPKGAGRVSPRQARAESFRRMGEDLMTILTPATLDEASPDETGASLNGASASLNGASASRASSKRVRP